MQLTNERLSRRFKNQFELVNYAIKLATNMIKTGRDSRIKTDCKNRAFQVLQEITAGVDRFDDIKLDIDGRVIKSFQLEAVQSPSLVEAAKIDLVMSNDDEDDEDEEDDE